MSAGNPEIAQRLTVNGLNVNYHDVGAGAPVMLIHGSGPGVTAWANWRLVIPALSQRARVIAPDMAGFGYSDTFPDGLCSMSGWVDQLIGLMDALGIAQTDLVGNSFGGGLALAVAIRHPQRVRKLVLMGAVGVPFPITAELDAVWGYQPSLAAMRSLLDIFAYDRGLVTDELAELRYRASLRPGAQESFSALFPAPRQRWVDALASAEADIRALPHETLVIHGRDDRVIPLQNALTLTHWIDQAQLHVFGRCGHWVQIEHSARFNRLVGDFLAE